MSHITLIGIVILCLGLAGWLTMSVHHHTSTKSTTSPVLMEIINSGSTNFAGWTLQVNANGSGVLSCNKGPQLNTGCRSTTFKASTFPAATLKSALADTSLANYTDTCAYSASFGATDTLVYDGVNTPGVDCYAQTQQTPLAKALSKVLSQIEVR